MLFRAAIGGKIKHVVSNSIITKPRIEVFRWLLRLSRLQLLREIQESNLPSLVSYEKINFVSKAARN